MILSYDIAQNSPPSLIYEKFSQTLAPLCCFHEGILFIFAALGINFIHIDKICSLRFNTKGWW